MCHVFGAAFSLAALYSQFSDGHFYGEQQNNVNIVLSTATVLRWIEVKAVLYNTGRVNILS